MSRVAGFNNGAFVNLGRVSPQNGLPMLQRKDCFGNPKIYHSKPKPRS